MIDRKRHEATHEAGHAVVGSVLGFRVKDVGFNEKKAGAAMHFAASTNFEDGDPCELLGAHPDEMTVVMMAGSVSEKVVLGEILDHGYTGDMLAIELCYPALPADHESVLKDAMRRAWEIASANQAEIAAVAEELLAKNRLSGSDVDAIIEHVRSG